MKNLYIIFAIIILLFPTSFVLAADDVWTIPDVQIKIPGLNFSSSVDCSDNGDGTKTCKVPFIAEYIAAIYKYAIGIVGILAVVVMMWGGVRWMTAGGNASGIGEARSWITAALTGLVLILGSYTILYFINPDLTNLKFIEIKTIKLAKEEMAANAQCIWELESTTCMSANVENFNMFEATDDKSKCPEIGETLKNLSTCCCSKVPQNCLPLKTGLCSVYNLEKYFGDKAAEASGICNAESSGNPAATNPEARCSSSRGMLPMMIGAFQINIGVNSIVTPTGMIMCGTSAFKDASWLRSDPNCKIEDSELAAYDRCVAAAKDFENNVATAKALMGSRGWGPWEANALSCHF